MYLGLLAYQPQVAVTHRVVGAAGQHCSDAAPPALQHRRIGSFGWAPRPHHRSLPLGSENLSGSSRVTAQPGARGGEPASGGQEGEGWRHQCYNTAAPR